jgi:hypothetical protein
MEFCIRCFPKQICRKRIVRNFLAEDVTPLKVLHLRTRTATYSEAHNMEPQNWPPFFERRYVMFPGMVYDHRSGGEAIVELEWLYNSAANIDREPPLDADAPDIVPGEARKFIKEQLMTMPSGIPVRLENKRRWAAYLTLAVVAWYDDIEFRNKLTAANDNDPLDCG